jgi:membrane protein implicated in regulation of membrane protease activity
MSQHAPAPTRRPSSGLWALIFVILLPAVVVPLWVPLYDKTDPTLWGFPFFFWFQFALILASAVLVAVAYALSLTADRRHEERRRTTRQEGDLR